MRVFLKMALLAQINYIGNFIGHIVVEILSPSTEIFDTGDKSSLYRRVTSLDHILLIAQDRLDVEYFSRIDAANWRSTRYTDLAASLPFVEISLRVPAR